MTPEDTAGLVALLEELSPVVWVAGGWGVDALVGRQTRPHADLDVAVTAGALPAVVARLHADGFETTDDWLPVRIEVAHPDGRRVDLHPVTFAADGTGTQPGLDGAVFVYPAGCSTTGRIAGREVHCLSAAQQLTFRSGFEWRPVDRHDVALLEAVKSVDGGGGMDGMTVEVSEPVHALVRSAGAQAWLAGLPELVDRLRREWRITVGRTYEDATEAYAAEASTADGTPVVLKILVRRRHGGHAAEEITVLELANGEGCVRLLRHDEDSGAMLLERLGPSMYRVGLPIEQRHEILCRVAMRLWRPAPDSGLRTGAAEARQLAAYVEDAWHRLDRPCSRAAVDLALAAAGRRAAAHDDDRALLLHGDVHQWNTLQAPGDELGWKLVDPDGLLAEPEADLGVLMREDQAELMTGDPRDRARWLAARTGTDAEAIWEWGLVQRMQNGLSCLESGLAAFGRDSLAVADRIASLTG